MIVSIAVPDGVVREAQKRNTTVEEFVDLLIDKGLEVVRSKPTVSNAIERIRALHPEVIVPKR